MAKTVNTAFQEFNKDTVNLIKERTDKARNSRDWLIKQLVNLPSSVESFPRLYDDMHIKFGSFARNTKIKPLDDIDLILAFSADGAQYSTIEYGKTYCMVVPDSATNLKNLCGDDGCLNSIKFVNKLVASLQGIDAYSSADIHRRQEAATLKLSSYEWNFDIVPAFYTNTGYYLIPDGSGKWKASDPRVDQQNATTINQKHDGAILQIIRTLKFWNRRASMITIPSYLFENIVLDYLNSQAEVNRYIDINLINFWSYLRLGIYSSVNDPKGFQGDLNLLTMEERSRVSEKARAAEEKGREAWRLETVEKDQEKSINKWREVFGEEFPKYG